jgi:hypothetical protein
VDKFSGIGLRKDAGSVVLMVFSGVQKFAPILSFCWFMVNRSSTQINSMEIMVPKNATSRPSHILRFTFSSLRAWCK